MIVVVAVVELREREAAVLRVTLGVPGAAGVALELALVPAEGADSNVRGQSPEESENREGIEVKNTHTTWEI